jgi:gamma-glutamyltranspeptidase/glutathione hydrolase
MVQAFNPADFEGKAVNGIVTASHPLAARAGISIMSRGGNAVDAAVATAFALTVVDPCMASIAGRGEMNIYLADEGKVHNVEFVAVCGEKAREDVYEVLPRAPGGWWSVKDEANNIGYRSICVPTALAGLCTAQEKFGTMELGEVIEPSIGLAANGFEVDAKLECNIDVDFLKLSRFPATAKILCPRGRPLMRGETLRMRDYAQTLRSIAKDGPDAFYRGDLADAMVRDMERNGGLVTRKDLETYRPNMNEPIRTSYRGYEIISGSPDCSGGRLALQSLNILENFDLGAYGENSPEYVHILAEVFKRAFADRLQYEADPRFTEIPARGMLSKEYARELKSQIVMDKASPKVSAGDPWKYEGRRGRPSLRPGLSPGSQGTTHLCAADKAGNMVALTETLCGGFGSGVTVPGTGVIMNNGMYWFNPVPGTANSVQPGKRHVANMAATLVLKDGEAMMVAGAAGGRRILTTVTELLTRVIDFKLGVKSLFLPRFHVEDEEPVEAEQSFYEEIPLAYSVTRALTAMGHRFQTLPSICVGCMIMKDPETGRLHGAAEPRNLRVGSIQAY